MKIILMIIILFGGIMLPAQTIYDIEVKSITGEDVSLSTFKGKVILLVNVASKCGFTKQYDGLQKIYDKYKDQGFVILGFPANNFMKQEPGTDEEIQEFCRINFGVTFPMFSKLSVRGKNQHPLYSFLTNKKTNPDYSGRITWNFNKFLIDRNGEIVNRFGSRVEPENEELIKAIENELNK